MRDDYYTKKKNNKKERRKVENVRAQVVTLQPDTCLRSSVLFHVSWGNLFLARVHAKNLSFNSFYIVQFFLSVCCYFYIHLIFVPGLNEGESEFA